MASGYLLQRKMSLNSTDSTQVRSTETLFSIPVNRSAFYCSAIQVNPEITPAIRISRYANPSLPLVTQIYFIPKYWIVAFRLFHTRSFIVYRVHGLVPSLSTLKFYLFMKDYGNDTHLVERNVSLSMESWLTYSVCRECHSLLPKLKFIYGKMPRF